MVEQIDLHASSITTQVPHDPQFAQMEKVQQNINPYLDHLAQVDDHPILDNATGNEYEEILDLANQIRAAKGDELLERKSTIHNFHALLCRIAELTERHIFERKEKDQKKREEVLGKNEDISNWTRRQGYSNFTAGALYPFFLLLTAQSEPYSTIFKIAKDIVPHGTKGFESWFESYKQGPQFDQSLYIQTASSEKQSLEGLKNMPRELQQKLQQMLRQELEAIRASGQRS